MKCYNEGFWLSSTNHLISQKEGDRALRPAYSGFCKAVKSEIFFRGSEIRQKLRKTNILRPIFKRPLAKSIV